MIPQLMTIYSQQLQEEWNATITDLLKNITLKNSQSPEAATLLSEYTKRAGKLIRPTLFLVGYHVYSEQEPSKELVRLALSFELLHLYLLIHDDIMDQSDTRRGGKSLHLLFKQHHAETNRKGDPSLYGQSMAMLMGDIIANEAEKLWTEALTNNVVTTECKYYFDTMKDEVYWGQYLDLALPSHNKLPSKTEILNVMKQKTGTYTIVRPLQIGALAAGIKTTHIEWITGYGESIGVAFQAVDDILGTFGDPSMTGKSAISDIKERKLTLMVYYAIQTANEHEKSILQSYYLEDKSNATADEIKEIIAQTQALDKTEEIIRNEFDISVDALKVSKLNDKNIQLFKEFAHFIIDRAK